MHKKYNRMGIRLYRNMERYIEIKHSARLKKQERKKLG
jgi:hypothetical protein